MRSQQTRNSLCACEWAKAPALSEHPGWFCRSIWVCIHSLYPSATSWNGLLAFQLAGLPACLPACGHASQTPLSCTQHCLLPRQSSSTDRKAPILYLKAQLLSAAFTPELYCTELWDPANAKKSVCQTLLLNREWMLLPSLPKTQKWPILQQHHISVQTVDTNARKQNEMQEERKEIRAMEVFFEKQSS